MFITRCLRVCVHVVNVLLKLLTTDLVVYMSCTCVLNVCFVCRTLFEECIRNLNNSSTCTFPLLLNVLFMNI